MKLCSTRASWLAMKLVEFVETVGKQRPRTVLGALAQETAASCRRMIVRDTDGRQMLDFLGNELRVVLETSFAPQLVATTRDDVARSDEFVAGEYTKFLASGDEKLAALWLAARILRCAKEDMGTMIGIQRVGEGIC